MCGGHRKLPIDGPEKESTMVGQNCQKTNAYVLLKYSNDETWYPGMNDHADGQAMAKMNTIDEFPGRCNKMLTTEINESGMWLTHWQKATRRCIRHEHEVTTHEIGSDRLRLSTTTKTNKTVLVAASPSVFDYGGNT
ncbi:hypothetical protein OUZ56_011763 [Daphnia magna]|uniref:Uncharacterized protein n=1 Tax=Daphnia magna TaxID=35525 RepID=A0ABQ9Z122_9CRUS|nr:hypothetical protein OUZ56_011763 [Daphnia magna]